MLIVLVPTVGRSDLKPQEKSGLAGFGNKAIVASRTSRTLIGHDRPEGLTGRLTGRYTGLETYPTSPAQGQGFKDWCVSANFHQGVLDYWRQFMITAKYNGTLRPLLCWVPNTNSWLKINPLDLRCRIVLDWSRNRNRSLRISTICMVQYGFPRRPWLFAMTINSLKHPNFKKSRFGCHP